MCMHFFFQPLKSHRFVFLGVCACRIFFSLSNILHEIFLVDRLVKRYHYESNYKGSVKESLKKSNVLIFIY